jgi:hypothetical protein
MSRKIVLCALAAFAALIAQRSSAVDTSIAKPGAQLLAQTPGSNPVVANQGYPLGHFAIRPASTSSLNASISSPVPPPSPTSPTTFKNGVVVAVTGTAQGSGFQNFQIDWAAGLDASSGWQTTGVTLAGAGASPVTSGSLGAWDTSSISTAGYYTVRLTVNLANTSVQALSIVYLEPDLLSANWPQSVSLGPALGASVIPARNPDGSYRLLLETPAGPGSATGKFWTLPLNAPAQSTLQTGHGGFFNPAVADFTGVGNDEAMMIDFDDSPVSSELELFHQDGTFTALSANPNLWYLGSQFVAEDLAGDSHLQTLGYGIDYTNSVAYISAWQPDGTQFNSNFPIQVPFRNPNDGRLDRNTVLVGDVNGDGKKEIVAVEVLSSSSFTLQLFAGDGSPLGWKGTLITGTPVVMAAADLDNNGMLETIVAANNDTSTSLFVLQPDGSVRPGWPLVLPNSNINSQSYLAVADLNVDGHQEIVYAHEAYLYVLNPDASNFSAAWPLNVSAGESFGYNAVAIGDVDGDGFPEIVTVLNTASNSSDPYFLSGIYSNDQLQAIRRDGTVSRSWQLNAGNGCWLQFWPTPAIGDFNQDGITDIAVTFGVGAGNCSASTPGVVTVLSTGAPYHPALNDWPLSRHDPRNTSVLRCSDFCLDPSSAQTVSAGESAAYTFSITPNELPYSTPIGGFTCSGLPTGASCTFSPSSVIPGTAPGSTTLMIATTSRTLAMNQPIGGTPQLRWTTSVWLGMGMFGALGIFALPGKRRFAETSRVLLVVFASAFFASCGGGASAPQTNPNGTPAGSYTVTVSATGGSNIPRTAQVTLIVE